MKNCSVVNGGFEEENDLLILHLGNLQGLLSFHFNLRITKDEEYTKIISQSSSISVHTPVRNISYERITKRIF